MYLSEEPRSEKLERTVGLFCTGLIRSRRPSGATFGASTSAPFYQVDSGTQLARPEEPAVKEQSTDVMMEFFGPPFPSAFIIFSMASYHGIYPYRT